MVLKSTSIEVKVGLAIWAGMELMLSVIMESDFKYYVQYEHSSQVC